MSPEVLIFYTNATGAWILHVVKHLHVRSTSGQQLHYSKVTDLFWWPSPHVFNCTAPSSAGTGPDDDDDDDKGGGGTTYYIAWFHGYLHPLPALGRCPFVAQLRQGSGHPLVHGGSGGLTGEYGTGHLQLLHSRLRQSLIAPHRDQGVSLGWGPRHPPASREAVGGGRGRRPARGPWTHVQRRKSVRRGGIGVVLITVTQILRLGGRHLGFGDLQRPRYLWRMISVAGRRHVASVAKGRGREGDVGIEAGRCGAKCGVDSRKGCYQRCWESVFNKRTNKHSCSTLTHGVWSWVLIIRGGT